MAKTKTKKELPGKPDEAPLDFYILSIGLTTAVVCTRLPIELASARLNLVSPAGTRRGWMLADEPNSKPCPTNTANTHYVFEC